MPSTAPEWWLPANHAGRRPFLMARNRIVAALRGWFEAEGFVEIEAAALQVSPGNETHLHAFATDWIGLDDAKQRLYLHTSPEFACKKLLAAGERQIFDFARVFRNREASALHGPEFTLLEWYRAGQSYERLMEDCTSVLANAAEAAGATEFRWRGCAADPFAAPERLTVADAFARYAGIDLLAAVPDDAATEPDRDALSAPARALGIRTAEDDTWSDIFSHIVTERIEPRLGIGRATILCEYPASEAALARRKPSDPRLSERFELYVCGVELANAFGELTDPDEQRRRFEADMDEKMRIYGESYPIDEDFLAALAIMPPASGIALGRERLLRLASGAARSDQGVGPPFSLGEPS